MTATPEQPRRVVLRYEDDWDGLRARLQNDRATGLTSSTVRDHLTNWLDQGSFVEVGSLVRRDASSYRGGDSVDEDQNTLVPADGLIAGWGRLGAQLVFVTADDLALGSSIRGGAAAAKATRVRQHALEQAAPLIQVLAANRTDHETPIGAEFVRFGYGVDLDFEHQSTERILKIAIVTGSLDDQAALEASWCHVVILAGPDAALYGHRGDDARRRGFADLVVAGLPDALQAATDLLRHLPPSCFDRPPTLAGSPGPPSTEQADPLLDAEWAVELWPAWRPTARLWFGRIGGRTVGLIRCADGLSLDGATTRKLLRLALFCRAFSLPLVVSHAGIDRATTMSLADLTDLGQLRAELATLATVLEVARTTRSIRADLGVRPIWSAGPPGDQVHDEVAALSDYPAALREVIHSLQPALPRPDQDERVKRRRPRGLQGG